MLGVLLVACGRDAQPVVPAPPAPAPSPPTAATPATAATSRSRTLVRTDRPVYRAGERIHVRVWRVDERWQPVREALTVTVKSVEGPVTDRVALSPDHPYAVLQIPSDGLQGVWEVIVSGPEGRLARERFVVRPSERLPYRIDARLERDVIPEGSQSVVAKVTVRSPDGAPVAGHGIHAVLRVHGRGDVPAVATTDANGAADLVWALGDARRGMIALRVDEVGGDPRELRFVMGSPDPEPALLPAPMDLVVALSRHEDTVDIAVLRDGHPVEADVALKIVAASAFAEEEAPLGARLQEVSGLPTLWRSEDAAFGGLGAPWLPWPEGLPLDPALPLGDVPPPGVWASIASSPQLQGRMMPAPGEVSFGVEPPLPSAFSLLEYCALDQYMDGAILNGGFTFARDGAGYALSATSLDSPELAACLLGRLARAQPRPDTVTFTIATPRRSAEAPYARPDVASFQPDPRGPETVGWWPALHTDAKGRLSVPLPPLPAGGWWFTADALGGGAAGTGFLQTEAAP